MKSAGLLLSMGALAATEPIRLNESQPIEFQQAESEGWRWFALPTGGLAAVTASLVVQRGYSQNFPRMGFVVMASTSGIPPGSLSPDFKYDPTVYQHDDPVGARRQFLWDNPTDGIRSVTDWKVLTLGIDTNQSADATDALQVPLGVVLIGIRCNELLWTGQIPGCRYSLTATLLPFVLAENTTISAPMGRGDTHVYRVTVGAYDSLNISLTRDVHNETDSPANGLVGVAMLQRGKWSRIGPLHYPYNLSGSPTGTILTESAAETAAMVQYQYEQLRADKGLLNVAGCASGLAGCRQLFIPVSYECHLATRTSHACQALP